jgi:hypothetical protein
MAKYRLLVDGYNITLTNYSDALQLADTEAEGSGSLKFILVNTSGDSESACGLTDLPALGSKLSSLGAYNGTDDSPIIYNNIRAISVGIDPLLSSDPNKPVYTIQYTSEGLVANKILDFSSNLQVVSFENPTNWRYADYINAQDNVSPSGVNSIDGSVQQRLSRTVVQGAFRVNKVVHPTQMGVFYDDYKTIAGKLNTELVNIYTGSLVQFNRGQLLCSTLSSGQYIGSLISFGVSFEFRIINDITAVTNTTIIRDDWQYVLSPLGTSSGGWLIPVRTTTSTTPTLTSNPYLYPYATEGLFNTFIADDYSTPI